MTLVRTVVLIALIVIAGLVTVSQRLALNRVGYQTARLETLKGTLARECAAMRGRYEAIATPRAAEKRLDARVEQSSEGRRTFDTDQR